jgi:hypothetical protein
MNDEMTIGQHACLISGIADHLFIIASTLREVNMDRLAERIELATESIRFHADQIPRLAIDDLNDSIRHNKSIATGLLVLALQGKIGG